MNLYKDDEIQKELEIIENEKKALDYKTSLAKAQFIEQMKSGLGEQIKSTKEKFEVVKISRWKKIGRFITRMFTRL